MGRGVSTKQLAQIWIVTPERVGQIARAGKIHKGPDGLFDLDQAMSFRKQQISDHEVNTLLKSYGSRHGTMTGMKVVDHLLSADEVLAEPAAPKVPDEVISEIAFGEITSMLLHIGEEAFGGIPYNVAKRLEGMQVGETVLKAVHDETMAALMRMQQTAMRFGFLIPETD